MRKFDHKRSAGFVAAAIIAATTLIATGPVLAHGKRGGDPEQRVERMTRKLDLSEEQRTAILAIVEESGPAMSERREAMRENRAALREVVESADADDAAIQALADTHGELAADLVMERAQMKRAIRAVLTPEQQAMADEQREAHAERRGKRRHHD